MVAQIPRMGISQTQHQWNRSEKNKGILHINSTEEMFVVIVVCALVLIVNV